MFPLYDDNRSGTTPWITRLLIVLNVLVFAYELYLGTRGELEVFVNQYAFVPATLRSEPAHAAVTIFTSMFVHGGWLHILSNMWFLLIFGDNVEDRFGHFPFLLFYLGCGVIAALTQAFFGDAATGMIGASGAISGVLGAYLVTYPAARIRTFVPIFIIFLLPWIPAVVFLPYWLVLQFASLRVGESGVAVLAHIGGFVGGAVLALALPRRKVARW